MRATTRLLNASPYRAIFHPLRPQVRRRKEATTILTWGECGTTARTFKSALIWVVADSAQPMREEAKKLLAWQAIADEAEISSSMSAEEAARETSTSQT
jgi:hypothetical protein